MRSLFLTFVYFAILALGTQAPLVFVLGYVWVDIFVPQALAYSILPSIPVALIMGACVPFAMLTLPRDPHVKLRMATIVTFLFACWMTMTLLWAAVPEYALEKWDWAFKSVAFSCFIPYFLRSRIDVEVFLWAILTSGIAHCIPFGLKVLISGGGYGKPLGLIQANHGYGEGSTLAMFAISLIPICLYLYKHQSLLPQGRLVKAMLISFMALAFLTSLGTYARTGLLSMTALGALLILDSKQVLRNGIVVVLLGVIALWISSDSWLARMFTIGDETDSSAMGRVAVWLWTLEYVQSNPWGGSFDVYRINLHSMVLADGSVLSIGAKAFHSIYFEVLGETGLPGFAMFMLLVVLTYHSFASFARLGRRASEQWQEDLGRRLNQTLIVYLVGGMFIGIGFQGYFYYLVALGAALLNLRNRPYAARK